MAMLREEVSIKKDMLEIPSSRNAIQELPGEQPADINLSKTSVRETRKSGKKVADLQAIDEDSTTQYILVDGIGSVDNDKFRIKDGHLIAKEEIDFERQSEYFIRVSSIDAGGDVREEALSIRVRDIKNGDPNYDLLTGLEIQSLGSTDDQLVGAAYDSTSVNFINNTASGAFRVQSLDNRFDRFWLNPGAQVRITGSIEAPSYDVNAAINVVGLSLDRNSTYVGNLRFENTTRYSTRSAFGFLIYKPIASSDGKSFLMSDTGNSASNKGYITYDSLFYPSVGKSAVWRPVREGVKVEVFDDFESGIQDIDDPFIDTVEFRSYYFGSVDGQKRWDLVATELPSLG